MDTEKGLDTDEIQIVVAVLPDGRKKLIEGEDVVERFANGSGQRTVNALHIPVESEEEADALRTQRQKSAFMVDHPGAVCLVAIPGAHPVPMSEQAASMIEGIGSLVPDGMMRTTDAAALVYYLAVRSLFASYRGLESWGSPTMKSAYQLHDELTEKYEPAVLAGMIVEWLRHNAHAAYEISDDTPIETAPN